MYKIIVDSLTQAQTLALTLAGARYGESAGKYALVCTQAQLDQCQVTLDSVIWVKY